MAQQVEAKDNRTSVDVLGRRWHRWRQIKGTSVVFHPGLSAKVLPFQTANQKPPASRDTAPVFCFRPQVPHEASRNHPN